jgi:hypothetical protein
MHVRRKIDTSSGTMTTSSCFSMLFGLPSSHEGDNELGRSRGPSTVSFLQLFKLGPLLGHAPKYVSRPRIPLPQTRPTFSASVRCLGQLLTEAC